MASAANKTLLGGSSFRTAVACAARLAERLRSETTSFVFASVRVLVRNFPFLNRGFGTDGLRRWHFSPRSPHFFHANIPNPSPGTRPRKRWRRQLSGTSSPAFGFPLGFLLAELASMNSRSGGVEVLAAFGQPALGLGEQAPAEHGGSGPGSATRRRTVRAVSARSGSRGHC